MAMINKTLESNLWSIIEEIMSGVNYNELSEKYDIPLDDFVYISYLWAQKDPATYRMAEALPTFSQQK